MKETHTFKSFLNRFVTEADDKSNKEDSKTAAKESPSKEEPSIDKDVPRIKDFEINGTTYRGVLSTFEAISAKQKAMGFSEVGLISLPGALSAYELFEDKETEESPDSKEPAADSSII